MTVKSLSIAFITVLALGVFFTLLPTPNDSMAPTEAETPANAAEPTSFVLGPVQLFDEIGRAHV